MKIPIFLPTNKNAQPDYNGKFITEEHARNWFYTFPHSVRMCMENNSNSFSDGEIIFINELLDSKDEDNMIIIFNIIDAKPEEK